MMVDAAGAPIQTPDSVARAAPALPTQDAYVQVLLRTEQMLSDAFDKLDAPRKRQVLDEIERRRAARCFANPGALRTLFPSLGMRRH